MPGPSITIPSIPTTRPDGREFLNKLSHLSSAPVMPPATITGLEEERYFPLKLMDQARELVADYIVNGGDLNVKNAQGENVLQILAKQFQIPTRKRPSFISLKKQKRKNLSSWAILLTMERM